MRPHTVPGSVLPKLRIEEIGIVCHGIHQTHLHIETEHSLVRNGLLKTLLDFPTESIVREANKTNKNIPFVITTKSYRP